MREILGYAPIEPDGSVQIKVPANVAFQISVLDAQRPPHLARAHATGCRCARARCSRATAATRPPRAGIRARTAAPGSSPRSIPGAAATGTPFPNTNPTFSPDAGETMAQTRARTSCANDTPRCAAMTPSVNVLFTDVWTDPAVRAPDPDISYSYGDPTFTTPPPTSDSCSTAWSATCRIVINYTQHIQPLWDKPRQVDAIRMTGAVTRRTTPARARAATARSMRPAAPQVPGGSARSAPPSLSDEEPLQLRSYRELLFSDNEQEVDMGALQDRLVPGPPDANGNPTHGDRAVWART